MRVDERMTKNVKCCNTGDSLAAAARLLWEHDCGCAPVVDEDGRLRGILKTDMPELWEERGA